MADYTGNVDYNKIKSIQFSGNGITDHTNWTKEEMIGQGAYGRVYRATVDNVIIAVKEVPNVSPRNKKNEETVRIETDALKKLTNERIITYYGSCAVDQMFYIFLEYMKGGSLDDYIGEKALKQETIDEAHAGRIIYQIVDGVAYLHENKVFHRDIKSANVLMSDEENVKLADFGLIKTFEEVSKSHTKGVGTVRFMAPEMVRHKSRYSNPVDIWAIGCIAVHMLSGKYPFPEAEEQQIFMQLSTDPTPAKEILLKVSESCRRFLEKTLAIEPKGRATANSLLHDHFVLGNGITLVQGGTDKSGEEIDAKIKNDKEVLDERKEQMQESKLEAGARNFELLTGATNTFCSHYPEFENVKPELLSLSHSFSTLFSDKSQDDSESSRKKSSPNIETQQFYTEEDAKRDVPVDKVENVEWHENLNELEELTYKDIFPMEIHKTEATENLTFKEPPTPKSARESFISKEEAETLKLRFANNINVQHVDNIHIQHLNSLYHG